MTTLFRIAAGAALALALSTPVAASPLTPVRIENDLSFATTPFSGSFSVSVGSGALGCSAGTFVDIGDPTNLGQIEKRITCTSGAGDGDTLIIRFHNDCSWLSRATFQCRPGPGDANGQWKIASGTGTLAGVRGGGDFSVSFTGETTAVEILTGFIH